jgi:hypothetical protein
MRVPSKCLVFIYFLLFSFTSRSCGDDHEVKWDSLFKSCCLGDIDYLFDYLLELSSKEKTSPQETRFIEEYIGTETQEFDDIFSWLVLTYTSNNPPRKETYISLYYKHCIK